MTRIIFFITVYGKNNAYLHHTSLIPVVNKALLNDLDIQSDFRISGGRHRNFWTMLFLAECCVKKCHTV